jgi:hypothetical protein
VAAASTAARNEGAADRLPAFQDSPTAQLAASLNQVLLQHQPPCALPVPQQPGPQLHLQPPPVQLSYPAHGIYHPGSITPLDALASIPYVQTNYLLPDGAAAFPAAYIPNFPFAPQFGLMPALRCKHHGGPSSGMALA